MIKAGTNEDLRAGFEKHLKQTREHVDSLERIAESYDIKRSGHRCKAMEGLIAEGGELINEDAEDTVRDAGLIGAAQRVEHYEITGYGTARALAGCLGYDEAVDLFALTLDEEKVTDEELSALAEGTINSQAAAVSTEA